MRQITSLLSGLQINTKRIIHALPLMLLILSGLESCASTASSTIPQRSSIPFSRFYFSETTGRVGYHVDSELLLYESDTPAGFPCDDAPDSWVHEGSLPPGLEWSSSSGGFSGTPRQPGNWTARLILHGVHCRMGADQSNYGDRTVTLRFTVLP